MKAEQADREVDLLQRQREKRQFTGTAWGTPALSCVSVSRGLSKRGQNQVVSNFINEGSP